VTNIDLFTHLSSTVVTVIYYVRAILGILHSAYVSSTLLTHSYPMQTAREVHYDNDLLGISCLEPAQTSKPPRQAIEYTFKFNRVYSPNII